MVSLVWSVLIHVASLEAVSTLCRPGPANVFAEHVMCDCTGWKVSFCECRSGPRVLVRPFRLFQHSISLDSRHYRNFADLDLMKYWLVFAPILCAAVGVGIELLLWLQREVKALFFRLVF